MLPKIFLGTAKCACCTWYQKENQILLGDLTGSEADIYRVEHAWPKFSYHECRCTISFQELTCSYSVYTV